MNPVRGNGRRIDCIVLYLYIYIALLAGHTNQKRFRARDPERREQSLIERKEVITIVPLLHSTGIASNY